MTLALSATPSIDRHGHHAATVAVAIFGHGLFSPRPPRVDLASREDGARSLSFVPPSPSLKLARKVGLVVTVSKNSAARLLSEAMLGQSASVAC